MGKYSLKRFKHVPPSPLVEAAVRPRRGPLSLSADGSKGAAEGATYRRANPEPRNRSRVNGSA